MIISILLRVIAWISAASLAKLLDFERQQPMQTFNPSNLTFRTWRSIYLNVKEASWSIALRFGDSHLEHFQHFRARLHEGNYYPRGNMGFSTCYRVCWPVDVQMQKQNGGSAVGHQNFTNVAFLRPWINYTDYTCYSFHSLLKNNMAHVTVDWNPLGKVFYR